MLRYTLNLTLIFTMAVAASIAVLMLGFFASPEAVRTSPATLYNSMLVDHLTRP